MVKKLDTNLVEDQKAKPDQNTHLAGLPQPSAATQEKAKNGEKQNEKITI
jgi:hypothetical protein